MAKERKDAIRELIQACNEKLPNSKYDRFFIEEYCKKLKQTETIVDLKKSLLSFN